MEVEPVQGFCILAESQNQTFRTCIIFDEEDLPTA